MSNAIIYAINEVLHKIPRDILIAGMNYGEQPALVNATTLEDKLVNKVIKKRVLLDANIVGGIETVIPLGGLNPSYGEYTYTVFQIPPEVTNGKEIISALSLVSVPMNGMFGQYNYQSGEMAGGFVGSNYGQSQLSSVINRIGDAAAPSGMMHNAHLEMIGYNTVLVGAHHRFLGSFGLRVILENDSNLNNITSRAYKSLGMLCSLAVKAYIYNTLILPINSGYLSGGQELGVFKSIVEEYSSAEEDYGVYLREVWAGVAFAADTTRMARHITSMISPDL